MQVLRQVLFNGQKAVTSEKQHRYGIELNQTVM